MYLTLVAITHIDNVGGKEHRIGTSNKQVLGNKRDNIRCDKKSTTYFCLL